MLLRCINKKIRLFLMIFSFFLLFIFSYNLSFTLRPLAKPKSTNNYSISSSFIQNWYCKDFTYERWTNELIALKELGIKELIVQTVVDTTNMYAIYPTSLINYSYNGNDSIKNLLQAAIDTDMKVRLGLGEGRLWWRKLGFDASWLEAEKNINIHIARELIANYGKYESLSGWYIPYEFYQYAAITKIHETNLNYFYRDISKYLKDNSNLNIMISPFYKANLSFGISLNRWTSLLINILKDTSIDIVALQDSIGAGFNTLDNIDNVFLYTKRATDELGIKLYGNIETFKKLDSTLVPQDKDNILKQIDKITPYVDGLISFSASHYDIHPLITPGVRE